MRIDNTIKRTKCVLNETSDINEVCTHHNFPIKIGCVDGGSKHDDLFYDLKWGISESSKIPQLMELIDPNILYSNEGHNSGKVGKIWSKHHQDFYEFIMKDPHHKHILEVGGGSGNLYNKFLNTNGNFKYHLVEPSDIQLPNDKRIVHYKSCIENFYTYQIFDTIIFSHVFEHLYNPNAFLLDIWTYSDVTSNIYISIPNMKYWLRNGFLNTLSYEHTYYVDYFVLKMFLNRCGFEIKEKHVGTHSIFVKAKKSPKFHTLNKSIGGASESFDQYLLSLDRLASYIDTMYVEGKLYLFGAHIFSQFILCGYLEENMVTSILDNDADKQNKRLYGTNLYVQSPEVLRGEHNPHVMVRCGNYTNEIKNQLVKINNTCIFV
jgi:hypothetical protein